MLASHREIDKYNGYTIYRRDPGFEFTPVMLAKVASFIVRNDDGHWTVVAMMYSLLLELDGQAIDESALLDTAVEMIHSLIDDNTLRDRVDLTFEYQDESFVEVLSPRWWIQTHR